MHWPGFVVLLRHSTLFRRGKSGYNGIKSVILRLYELLNFEITVLL